MTDSRTPEEQYPKRTRRKRNNRRKMIEATRKLLRKYPAADITLQQVADTAGVHVTTLFHHFDSKADLLTGVAEPPIEAIEEAVAASMGAVGFFDFLREAFQTTSKELEEGAGHAGWVNGGWRQPELAMGWLNYEARQIELLTEYLCLEFDLDPKKDMRPGLMASMIVAASVRTYDAWVAGGMKKGRLRRAMKEVTEVTEGLIRKGLG